MKNKNVKWATLCGIVVVGVSLGYLLRLSTQETWSEREEQNQSDQQEMKSRRRAPSRAESFKHDLQKLEGSSHWLYLVSGVEGASLDELVELVISAKGNKIALRLIAQYWIEQDPQHLFDAISEKSKLSEADHRGFPYLELSKHLFDLWPRTDPDAAIAALSVTGKLVAQRHFRNQVYVLLMRIDPKRGLALGYEWDVIGWIPNTAALKKWVKKDPLAAAEAVLVKTTHSGSEVSAKALAEVWGESDPEAALNYTLTKRAPLSRLVQETVMKSWAKRDFDAASTWLGLQNDSALQTRLTLPLIEAWGQTDPDTALAWCQEHLEGSLLNSAVGKLAAGAAAKDVESAAAMVSGLEKSTARTLAGVEVARVWFPKNSTDSEITPAKLDWLRGLDDIQMQGEILKKIGSAWLRRDRDSLISFLSESHAKAAPDSLFRSVASDIAFRDPELAFKWAADLPENRSERVAGHVFNAWLRNQPELAENWLKDIPETDGRRPHLIESYIGNGLWEPDEVLFRRLVTLKPGDAQMVEVVVGRAAMSEAKKQRILSMLGK